MSSSSGVRCHPFKQSKTQRECSPRESRMFECRVYESFKEYREDMKGIDVLSAYNDLKLLLASPVKLTKSNGVIS
jgi:hypothetical protein